MRNFKAVITGETFTFTPENTSTLMPATNDSTTTSDNTFTTNSKTSTTQMIASVQGSVTYSETATLTSAAAYPSILTTITTVPITGTSATTTMITSTANAVTVVTDLISQCMSHPFDLAIKLLNHARRVLIKMYRFGV